MSEVAGTRERAAIDFDAAGGVDRARLERCLRLRGERVGYGRYHFTGGKDPHWVDLYTTAIPRCDCADHIWRDAICSWFLQKSGIADNEGRVGNFPNRFEAETLTLEGYEPHPHIKAQVAV